MAHVDVVRPEGYAAPLPATPAVSASAVSWGAVLAGAAAAAALSLILVVLGAGLGLASSSPWSGQGLSATTIGLGTALWLAFTQLFASGIGGYLAGRLRVRWTSAVHGDEIYFRDTAHGLLAWSVATLATAALLGGALTSAIGGGLQAGATVAAGAAGGAGTAAAGMAAGASSPGTGGGSNPVMAYVVDTLYRPADGSTSAGSPSPAAGAASAAAGAASGAAGAASVPDAGTTPQPAASPVAPTVAGDRAPPLAETTRILAQALANGTLAQEDARYLARHVTARTGLPPAQAEQRVTAGFERIKKDVNDAEVAAKEAADKARKLASGAALWTFASLLFGALVASFAATLGGRQREA